MVCTAIGVPVDVVVDVVAGDGRGLPPMPRPVVAGVADVGATGLEAVGATGGVTAGAVTVGVGTAAAGVGAGVAGEAAVRGAGAG